MSNDSQSLCPYCSLHGKVNVEDFAAGCVAEQKRIYGHSPHEDVVKNLERKVADADLLFGVGWHETMLAVGGHVGQTIHSQLTKTVGDLLIAKDRIAELEEENRRLRERCPMTVQEICERADAAEAAARRYQQVVEQGDGTAQEVVDGAQPGGLQPPEQAG